MASATSRSELARRVIGRPRPACGACLCRRRCAPAGPLRRPRPGTGARALTTAPSVVVAVGLHRAPVAQRARLADAPAVQDQRVGGARSSPGAARRAHSCCSTTSGSSRRGEPDAVRHAQHVAVDGQAGHAERVAEDDVRGLAADARQRHERLHARRHLAPVLRDEALRHAEERPGLLAEEAGRCTSLLELVLRRPRRGRARRDSARTAPASPGSRRASVDCAERIVATSSSKGVRVVQLGVGAGVLRTQRAEDRAAPRVAVFMRRTLSAPGPCPGLQVLLAEQRSVLLQRGDQVRHELHRHDDAGANRRVDRCARSRPPAGPSR